MRTFGLVLALATLTLCGADPPAPEVQIEEGTVRGKWIQSRFLGRSVAAFEGIPYAEPPVGASRFQPPVAAAPWAGVKMATRVSAVCTQRDTLRHKKYIEGSEDCLYLNVYAPETVSRAKPLPVMVFVHGGGFFCWSGSMFGPELLMDRDVVYVNFNYRLGPLGFLSTADEVIPGNNGMKDMVMALAWVRKNVRSFGGDPDSVTIFGESAGGAAVHYMTLSPLAEGLFHRAIAMSGNANAYWAMHDAAKAKASASKLASLLDCPQQPSEQLLQCLQGKSAEDIIGTDMAFSEWFGHPMVPFKLVAERGNPNAFIDRPASQLIPHHVPLMIGTVADDGCIMTAPLLQIPGALRDLNERFTELASLIFFADHLPEKVKTDIFQEVRNLYFGDKSIAYETKSQLSELMSDAFFVYSTLDTIKQHKKHTRSPVFYYELRHLSKERTFATMFGGDDLNATFGMCHCDDLAYLFPLSDVFAQRFSTSDRAYADLLLNLFTTFAATGQPTTDDSWPSVQEADDPECAYISDAGPTMRRKFRPEKQRLWTKLRDARVSTLATSPNDEL